MQIIIDISEDLYKATINGLRADEIRDLRLAVEYGTPFTSRVMKEIEEIINCDAVNAEAKCRMIFDTITAKPYYFKEPQESEE